MGVLPRSVLWRRTDVVGVEHALLEDRQGLRARGVAMAVDPIPYTARYQLVTDEHWATRMFEVEAEGGGWRRQVRLERAAGRWRVTTSEQGRLDKVLAAAGHPGVASPGSDDPAALEPAYDVDLLNSPLTNTLVLRRLGLVGPDGLAAGAEHTVTAAFVVLPSLLVLPSTQTYTLTGRDTLRYASGDFRAELAVDGDGYVERYEGLAERAG